MSRLKLTFVTVAATALSFAGLGLAASHKETYKLRATLTAAQDKAKSKGTGAFTGTLVESGKSKTLTWKLTFKSLTGAASAAHIHLGKRGVAGPVAVPLCGPCKSGVHGTAKLTEKIVKAIENHGAYVNVHTAKYKNGEIRGQISIKH
jgi:CHRD domain-containing protein